MTPKVYAGLVTRTTAFVLDALLINAVALVVAGAALLILSLFPHTGDHRALLGVIGAGTLALWTVSYFVVFWSTTGQTPGDRLMQIRVTRLNGARMRPRHALIRLGGMVVSLPLFWGYFPILTNERRRGFFDGLAGTVVIVDSPADGGWGTTAPPRHERPAAPGQPPPPPFTSFG